MQDILELLANLWIATLEDIHHPAYRDNALEVVDIIKECMYRGYIDLDCGRVNLMILLHEHVMPFYKTLLLGIEVENLNNFIDAEQHSLGTS